MKREQPHMSSQEPPEWGSNLPDSTGSIHLYQEPPERDSNLPDSMASIHIYQEPPERGSNLPDSTGSSPPPCGLCTGGRPRLPVTTDMPARWRGSS